MIPQEMRERLGVGQGDELVLHLLSDRMLVAEAVGPSRFERALARLEAEARERGITREDVDRAVAEVKQEVYREWKERRIAPETASGR